MKRYGAIIVFTALLLLTSVNSATAAPIYGKDTTLPQAGFQIQKWIDDTEVKVGTEITVHVNITNMSNYTASDLTIVEPIFQDYSFNLVSGYASYQYTKIKSQATVYYEYTLKPKFAGKFVVEPTEITYYDYQNNNDTQLFARSTHIDFSVYDEVPPSAESQLWRTLFTYMGILILIPILFYYIQKFLWRI